MSESLHQLAHDELLPAIAHLGFTIGDSEVSESFDNALVVLESPGLRVRLVRERGIVVVDFGPVSERGTWFDSSLIFDYLGLSSDGGFHEHDARRVFHAVGVFLPSLWSELTTKFGVDHLATTKRELLKLAERRAAKMFDA